jgi:hypothetical protein
MLKKFVFSLFMLSMFVLSAPTFAADKACLSEGSITFGDGKIVKIQTIEVKECRLNTGMPEKNFEGMCNIVPPGGKVTYMSACPAQPQGTCKGLFGGILSVSYYKSSAESLADTKRRCASSGGTWQ